MSSTLSTGKARARRKKIPAPAGPPKKRGRKPKHPELGGIDRAPGVKDEELLKRAIRGDRDAFDILVQRYQKKVYHLAYSMTHNEEDAREVQQEVFLTVHLKMKKFKGNSAFATWLFRVSMNCALMLLRKRNKDTSVSLEESPSAERDERGPERGVYYNVSDSHSDTESNYLRGEMQKEIEDAMEAIPDDLRVVLHLREFENLSYKEISDILRLRVLTVKSRLQRARTFTRRRLDKYAAVVSPTGRGPDTP